MVIANQQAADAMRKAANSLTILGGKVPGGFYNATYVRPMSVQRINGPGTLLLGPNAQERRRQGADLVCCSARRREYRSQRL